MILAIVLHLVWWLLFITHVSLPILAIRLLLCGLALDAARSMLTPQQLQTITGLYSTSITVTESPRTFEQIWFGSVVVGWYFSCSHVHTANV